MTFTPYMQTIPDARNLRQSSPSYLWLRVTVPLWLFERASRIETRVIFAATSPGARKTAVMVWTTTAGARWCFSMLAAFEPAASVRRGTSFEDFSNVTLCGAQGGADTSCGRPLLFQEHGAFVVFELWSCASVAADPDRHVVIGVEPRWADRVEKAREVGKAFRGVVRELIEIARASVDDDALAPRIWMPIAVMWLRP